MSDLVMSDLIIELNSWMMELEARLINKDFYTQMATLVEKDAAIKTQFYSDLSSTLVTPVTDLTKDLPGILSIITPHLSPVVNPAVTIGSDLVKSVIAIGTAISKYRNNLSLNGAQRNELELNLNSVKLLGWLQEFNGGPIGVSSLQTTAVEKVRSELINQVCSLLYYRHMFLLESTILDGHAGKFIQFLGKLITAKVLDDNNCYGSVLSRFLRAACPAMNEPLLFRAPFILDSFAIDSSFHGRVYFYDIFYKADRIYISQDPDPSSTIFLKHPVSLSCYQFAEIQVYPPIIDFDVDTTNDHKEYLYASVDFLKQAPIKITDPMSKFYDKLYSNMRNLSLEEILGKINSILDAPAPSVVVAVGAALPAAPSAVAGTSAPTAAVSTPLPIIWWHARCEEGSPPSHPWNGTKTSNDGAANELIKHRHDSHNDAIGGRISPTP
jgi:hypothetical protein